MKPRCVYQFGDFRLDATARVLLRGDEPVHLPRKAAETLLALVENCGQVVTRDELMAAVWPDRTVDDANLAQNIAVVRKAIGAGAGEPGSIETFPGRGYRILGPVIQAGADAAPEPVIVPPAPSRPATKSWVLAGLVIALGSAAVLVAWNRKSGTQVAEEPRHIPVTRLAGKEHQPAISPDGKSVAFVWDRPGEGESGIWIQNAWETSPRRVTPEGGGYASPTWSPDGRRLAFLRFQHSTGAVMIGALDGSPPREVAQVFPTRHQLPYRHLDWSPDGRSLAMDDAPAPHQPFAIYILSLETGEKRRLTTAEDLTIGDLEPHFSPDGKTLSFIRAFHRAHQELFSVALAGGTPTQLTADNKRVTGQDWLPDGKTLVFASDRGGEYRLWKLAHPPVREPRFRQTGTYGDFAIQLSAARGAPALTYSILHQDLNIWRLDLKGSDRWRRVVASSGLDASPQYSPGGDRITFRSDRSGDEQLWVSDSDGGNPVQITKRGLRPSVGRWAPDGQSVVFNDASTREIFIARPGADGSWNIKAVGGIGIHPVFSPDAQWIYAGGNESIVRYPVNGGSGTEIVKTRGISLGLSPDGEYVYFVRDPSGSQLWRVHLATGRMEMALDGLVPYCSSCWALAANGIYYLGTGEGAPDRQTLRFRNLQSRKDTAILEYPEPLNPIGSGPFSLSADGRYLLCVRVGDSNADVLRVEPFR